MSTYFSWSKLSDSSCTIVSSCVSEEHLHLKPCCHSNRIFSDSRCFIIAREDMFLYFAAYVIRIRRWTHVKPTLIRRLVSVGPVITLFTFTHHIGPYINVYTEHFILRVSLRFTKL